MAQFTAPRLRAVLAGRRWLSPTGERVLVDLIAVLVGMALELTLLYDDGSPIHAIPVLLTVAGGAFLILRRPWPVPVLVVMLAVTAVLFAMGEFPGGALVCVALFTVAERSRTWVSVASLVGATVVLVALSVASVPVPVAVWAIGAALRSRRLHLDDLEARAVAARVEREQRAALAAHEQRAEIARELHDIVAHSVTVMLVGVRGARDALPSAPDVAADVLARVETSGEHSLAELRRLLALLRGQASTGVVAPHRPVPGLADLPELARGFRAAGLAVDLDLAAAPSVSEEGVGLSVYRIVEEALTNVVRHAEADRATVRVVSAERCVLVEITDDGVGSASGEQSGGHGLIGMRERARLLGGELTTGPHANGGFGVTARLPLQGEQ